MVHISDGVLPPVILGAGFILSGVLLYFSLKGMRAEEIPKVSLITSTLFVASLLHFPVGPTSVHLVMNGLAGIMLGRRAYASVFVALTLQAIFFQHGGLTSLGVNAFNIGLPALLVWKLFERRWSTASAKKEAIVFGSLAGGLAILGSVLLVSLELLAMGEAFREISIIVIGAHLPVILLETAMVGGAAGLLMRVMPEMLIGDRSISEVN